MGQGRVLFLNSIPGDCLADQYHLNGGQYIQQPNYRTMNNFSRERLLWPLMPVASPTGGPASQTYCDGSIDLPTASASTGDGVDGLVNSFNNTLYLSNDAPSPRSNTCNIGREGWYWCITS